LGSINDLLRSGAQYVKQRAVQDTEELVDLNDRFWHGVNQVGNFADELVDDIRNTAYQSVVNRQFTPGQMSGSVVSALERGAQGIRNMASQVGSELNRGAAKNRAARGLDYSQYKLDDVEKIALDIATQKYGLDAFPGHLAAMTRFDLGSVAPYLDEGELRILEAAKQEAGSLYAARIEEARQGAGQWLREEVRRRPNATLEEIFTGGRNAAPDMEAEMFQAINSRASSRVNQPDPNDAFAVNSPYQAPAPLNTRPSAMTRQEFNPQVDEARYDSVPRQSPETPIRYFDELDTPDGVEMGKPDFSGAPSFRSQKALEEYLRAQVQRWR
jgi:hypothetical protein